MLATRWFMTLSLLGAALSASSSAAQQIEFDKLLPPNPVNINGFGTWTDVDGDLLAVGAVNIAPNGALYLFERSGSAWTFSESIPTPRDADLFGRPVALDGDMLIVGDSSNDNVNTNAGASYAYRKTPQGWSLVEKLVDPAGAPTASFGVRMDLRFPLLGVAVAGGHGVTQSSGKAIVYRWDGQAWAIEATLIPSQGGFGWVFGSSVAIHESLDLIVVGAENESPGIGSQGAAYVFVRYGSEWIEEARLNDPHGAGGQQFGQDVSLHGSTLLVGADGDDDLAMSSGAAWFFERRGTEWTPAQKIYPSNPFPQQRFGNTVDVNGDTAIISSYGINPLDRIYQFERVNGTWIEKAQLVTSEQTGVDGYPENVNYEGGNMVFSGANGVVTNGIIAGAVYVHVIDTPPATYCTGKVNSLGCVPQIGSSGKPTLSGPDDFLATATEVLPQRPGLLLFGQSGELDAPFFGATLCVAPPLKRTSVQLSSTGTACDGTYAFAFTQAYMASHRLDPGDTVHCQYWMRDVSHPDGTGIGLSTGLEFDVQP